MSNIDKIRQEIKRRYNYENEMYHKKKLDGRPNDGWAESLAIMGVLEELLTFLDTLSEETKNHGCGVEFPHFGANYPDAKCIDGYLWDMDSYEDGVYTIGGDDPCPICNTEEWLKDVLDDEIFKTRDEALEYVKMLESKYKHKDSLPEEPDKSLEEEAEKFAHFYDNGTCDGIAQECFKAGAEWQYQKDRGEFAKIKVKTWCEGFDAHKEQMLKDSVEGLICATITGTDAISFLSPLPKELTAGDKVRIVILKEKEE